MATTERLKRSNCLGTQAFGKTVRKLRLGRWQCERDDERENQYVGCRAGGYWRWVWFPPWLTTWHSSPILLQTAFPTQRPGQSQTPFHSKIMLQGVALLFDQLNLVKDVGGGLVACVSAMTCCCCWEGAVAFMMTRASGTTVVGVSALGWTH